MEYVLVWTIVIYVLFINIITFLMYYTDKKKAVKGIWRISERALIGMAVLGGSVGAMLSMQVFRHKTKHKKFFIGVPLILTVQAVIGVLALTYFL